MEKWIVIQDGNRFYVQIPGQDVPDVFEYPYPVSDYDIDGARDARAWFDSVVRPDDVEIEWSMCMTKLRNQMLKLNGQSEEKSKE